MGAKNAKRRIKNDECCFGWRRFSGHTGWAAAVCNCLKAIAFEEALSDDYFKYMMQVVRNAKAMSNALVDRGYKIISGGTDNHLMLIDLRSKNITGKQAENALKG